MTDTRIFEYFAAHSGELTNDISALVAVNSVKGEPEEEAPYGAGPRAALSVAANIAEGYGLKAEILGDRICVVEYGEGKTELGILAHLDVVPPAGEWTKTEPFEMLFEDGILYGRGVIDDKGPAMVALHALRAVKDLDIELTHKVRLILGSDEENGSSDIEWYLKNYKMPPKVFTPDGSFPLVNTEKGKLDITVSLSPWSEHTGAHIVSIYGGSVSNAVPAKCAAVVAGVPASKIKAVSTGIDADFEIANDNGVVSIVCFGKASHASLPDAGKNAVTAMLKCLSGLALDDTPEFKAVRALSRALPFGDNAGKAIGTACSDEISGALTVNLGVIKFSASEGMNALIDCRVPLCGDGKKIAEALTDAIAKDAVVTVTGALAPHNVPEDSEFVQGLLKIYEDYTDEKGKAMALGGLTYVHEVEGGVAFGCEFPGTETHMHEPDECVPLSELVLAGQMFAQAIADFCG